MMRDRTYDKRRRRPEQTEKWKLGIFLDTHRLLRHYLKAPENSVKVFLPPNDSRSWKLCGFVYIESWEDKVHNTMMIKQDQG
jgi:hypothetical protein